MSLLDDLKNRSYQKKGKAFINSLTGKNETEVKQMYLDNKDMQSNEIVLSHLFFNYTFLICMLPLEFQKTMINSNLSMFNYGSPEAKKSLVSDWLKDNKFFMNSKNLNLDTEEYESYICMYFNQPNDVAKLFMDDLYKVIEILSSHDMKRTEDIINSIKDELTERQWDFILKVNPIFIKYANQDIQNKYSDSEEYSKYISGEAREKYIKNQLEKVSSDISLMKDMPIDIQKEFIISSPYMINYIDEDLLTELLKYDIELLKYVNISSFKNTEVIYNVLENVVNNDINEIINVFVDKCLLNAKGKLFRYDKNSNNISYQTTKRLVRIIQNLSIDNIISLINIDVNYAVTYVVPLYNENIDRSEKESIALEANSRCLNLFKAYYGEQIYAKYYKIINKIYNEYISNIEKYDWAKDYDSIMDLFKVIFNKNIVLKNSPEKLSVFVGISLFYKGKENNNTQSASIKLLNELLSNAYNKKISLENEMYDIMSLEIFDNRLSFINQDLLTDISKYNYINMSTLLYIVKNEEYRSLFVDYYSILSKIGGENKETLLTAIENFTYYKDILKDIKDKELSNDECNNLIRLLVSSGNYLNVKTKDELSAYDINLLKRLLSDWTNNNDEVIRKNLICNYLFNKPYNEKGDTLWLELSTVKNYCDICDIDVINDLNILTDAELKLLNVIKLLFSVNDSELLIAFLDSIVNSKIEINIVSVMNLFNKLKKYKIDIINNQIVSLDDIENLYESSTDAVTKEDMEGVTIYRFNNQDFKVLSSFSNDGVHYDFKYISEITKNCYGYNKLVKTGSVRLSSFENDTIIKFNKDRKTNNKMKPDFIITKKITPDIITLCKNNNLSVIDIVEGII